MKVMVVSLGRFIEEPAPRLGSSNVCIYCACYMTDACADALDGAAEKAFGGDCEARDVVYARAPRILPLDDHPRATRVVRDGAPRGAT